MRSTTSSRVSSPSPPCPPGSRVSAICTLASTTPCTRWTPCWNGPTATVSIEDFARGKVDFARGNGDFGHTSAEFGHANAEFGLDAAGGGQVDLVAAVVLGFVEGGVGGPHEIVEVVEAGGGIEDGA